MGPKLLHCLITCAFTCFILCCFLEPCILHAKVISIIILVIFGNLFKERNAYLLQELHMAKAMRARRGLAVLAHPTGRDTTPTPRFTWESCRYGRCSLISNASHEQGTHPEFPVDQFQTFPRHNLPKPSLSRFAACTMGEATPSGLS